MTSWRLWPRAGNQAAACRFGWLLAVAVAMFFAAACTVQRPPDTPGTPGVIYTDDFSDVNSGWDRHTGTDVTTDYEDGRYVLAIGEPGVNVWARPGLDLTDAEIEAESYYTGGPENNEYGLICRYSRAGDGRNSFYFFLVSSDGYYAMGKVVRDVRIVLHPAEGSFQPTDVLDPQRNAVNRLRARCQGNRMALWANDVLLGEFSDAELTRGDVGLIAGTYDEGGVRIHFDNVVVRRPD
jgi:hypothetical protein